MEEIILLVILVISILILRYIFEVNMKKIKEFAVDEKLDKIAQKYPSNIEICKEYLKKLNNKDVNIEEDKNSNNTLYLVLNNKILIGNLNNNYTRIQTIAHECLHSIQSKRMLWFNFIFSNIYLIYFAIICILAIFKVLPYKSIFLSILIIFGMIFYAVRTYLENDAMIKARYLAKEYMQEKNISSQEEIDEMVNKYDKLNDIGIKCTNYKFISAAFIRIIIFLLIIHFF